MKLMGNLAVSINVNEEYQTLCANTDKEFCRFLCFDTNPTRCSLFSDDVLGQKRCQSCLETFKWWGYDASF